MDDSMTAGMIPAPVPAPAPRRPMRLGYLLLALACLDVAVIGLMWEPLTTSVDRALAAAPLVRKELRGVLIGGVIVLAPLVRLLWLVVLALLCLFVTGARAQAAAFAALFRIAAFAALPLACGKLVNATLVLARGQGDFRHNYFSAARVVPAWEQTLPLLARIDAWDVLAAALLFAGLRACPGSNAGRAALATVVAFVIPLLLFLRLQQIMGH